MLLGLLSDIVTLSHVIVQQPSGLSTRTYSSRPTTSFGKDTVNRVTVSSSARYNLNVHA